MAEDNTEYDEPGRRSAGRNRFLRMFRNGPCSRCRLLPRQAHRCCKALRAYQAGNIDGGDRESNTLGRERHECVYNNQKSDLPISFYYLRQDRRHNTDGW